MEHRPKRPGNASGLCRSDLSQRSELLHRQRGRRILLLDARSGSPPSPAGFLALAADDLARLEARLASWEEWALDLLQTHLSYPMLAYYRSLHSNQSWLAGLAAIVDASALLMLGAEGALARQAAFTFAAGRHALAHTAAVFHLLPSHAAADRLPSDAYNRLIAALAMIEFPLEVDRITHLKLSELRAMYEPSAEVLAGYFLFPLPPGFPAPKSWRIGSSAPGRSS